jgi:DNA-binding XRE family transcriptional regulator
MKTIVRLIQTCINYKRVITLSDFFKKYSDIRGEKHVQNLQRQGYIAAQIKTHRHNKGLSQQQLADLIQVPKSTVGRIEAGMTTPRLDTLLKIADALETTFIIGGEQHVEEILYPNVN